MRVEVIKDGRNSIAAQSENLKNDKNKAVYKQVVEAFQSTQTEKVFQDDFGGNYVKVGWDKELISE